MKRKTSSLLLLLSLPLLLLLLVQCDWFDDDDDGYKGPFVLTTDTYDNTLTLFSITDAKGTLVKRKTLRAAAMVGPTMALLHPGKKFLFVVNSDAWEGDGWGGQGSVAVFRYGSSGPGAQVAGSPFRYSIDNVPQVDTPINAAVTPDGRYLYLSDQGNGCLHIFSINAATGALTATAASPVDANDTHGIAMHPSGKFLFDGDEGGGIRSWAIDNATGNLTGVAGSPFSAPGSIVWINATADGKYVYAIGNGTITAFSVNTDDGTLAQIQQFFPKRGEKGAALSPDGRFLATANFNNDSVSVYTVSAEDGTLSEIEGSPYPTGDQPKNVSFSAGGKFLYACNRGSSTVNGWAVDNTTGALTAADNVASGKNPKFLAVLP